MRATTLGPTVQVGLLRQIGKVVVATLIEGTVIMGFVVLSLGIGGEGHVGVGADRPRLVSPAPAPPPDPLSILG